MEDLGIPAVMVMVVVVVVPTFPMNFYLSFHPSRVSCAGGNPGTEFPVNSEASVLRVFRLMAIGRQLEVAATVRTLRLHYLGMKVASP